MDPQLSPGAWLQFLEPRLDGQANTIQQYQDYYDGKHRLAFATAKFREAFSRYFPPLADNWMQIVVDTPVSRLTVQGFRFDTADDVAARKDTPPWELDADEDAWKMWQANNLDSRSRMIHTDAVKLGVAYVLVSPPKKPGGQPLITPEHASQCYVYCDPEDPNNRLAGIKKWVSDFDGRAYCDVYLPTLKVRWVSTGKWRQGMQIQWTRRSDDPGGPNRAGVVPLVPLENKPDTLGGGRSDLEQAIPIQDAVNKFCLDMQVSGEFHAYPQRWATGWERGVDGEGRELSNREVEVYLSASRFLRAESPEAKFGNFTQGDVDNYIKPIELYINHLAAQTQTPLYYLKNEMRAMSADGMHAQDQGLVDRCRAKILSFSDGWEEVMRVGFLFLGDPDRGGAESAEVIWADVESKSLAVVTQSCVMQRQSLSVPVEMCWEQLGWSPQKIRLARDLMGLPPGGAIQDVVPMPAPGQQVSPGEANDLPAPGQQVSPGEANDPTTHPGNQPGLPSGLAAWQPGQNAH